ncbi:hypothetical protein [Mucilaginibacter sp.]|jgi:hypothetical protein|uniref:hypothetical protein n=1 Tax=Mucilaginibacter sp. TaxID=1882438 RepID=UPI0035688408
MRFFEKLDKLNQHDTEHGTAQIGICNQVVAVNKNGSNGTVTIGVPGEVAQELALQQNNKRVILLIIDKTEFDKL